MHKVFIIIQREFWSRVKKPSFIAMCILGPLLIAVLWLVPFFLVQLSKEHKIIAVVDDTEAFKYKIRNSEQLTFLFQNNIDVAYDLLAQKNVSAVLYIPKDDNVLTSVAKLYYNENPPNILVQSYIQAELQNTLRKDILTHNYKLSSDAAQEVEKSYIELQLQNIAGAAPKYYGVRRGVSIFGGLAVYFFIFIFASWVMRGVVEEKSSRILEVMVSSIRPVQLMAGKIIGIACVGLLQCVCWVLISYGIIAGAQQLYPKTFSMPQAEKVYMGSQKIPTADQLILKTLEKQKDNPIIEGLFSINYGLIISVFIFYFLLGYLLYAALFAAVGAITDNETDTQQFTAPITAPLLLGIIVALLITAEFIDPKGQLAAWLSIIPFTSPIVMMARIPFGVPIWQLVVSAGTLIVFFVLILFFSAKIYRIGILSYGKKITYRDLWKWLRF